MLAAVEFRRHQPLQLRHLRLGDELVEHDDERVRVHLLDLERPEPQERISVVEKSAAKSRVQVRIPVGNFSVATQSEEVVPGIGVIDAVVEKLGQGFHLVKSGRVSGQKFFVLLLLPEFRIEGNRESSAVSGDRTSLLEVEVVVLDHRVAFRHEVGPTLLLRLRLPEVSR